FAQTTGALVNISGRVLADVDVTFSGPPIIASNVLVENVGTGIGVYRITTSAPWLRVTNTNEPWVGDMYRSLDGGVVLGTDMAVVESTNPLVYGYGHAAQLGVLIDPESYPGGTLSGTVTIEPLVGGSVPLT